ncbi:MAG: low molecular weight phosphotyrosine protein phosphatase [Acidobacteria bacterium]|nr:low molecular weight phosphotyrosine protein phosphatase [Acidobacteriota bacterium]
MTARVQRILFVCLGNICRSPAAEALLRHELAERCRDGSVEVDSAGTLSYHQGQPPDERMRQAAAERGYEIAGRSRPVVAQDFERFDLIVAMDRSNLSDLEAMAPAGGAPIRLFSDFLPAGSPADVPDPFYGGPGGFDTVLDLLEEGCSRLISELPGDAGPNSG